MSSYLSLATNSYHQGKYKECITFCTQALAQNPSESQAWKLCSFALYALGNLPKAIEYLEYFLEICPDDLSLWITLAEMYRRNGNPQKTIQILTSFLPSDYGDLHFNLARAYSDLNIIDKAIKHYYQVLQIQPNDTEAMYNLANALLENKDFDTAIKMYQKAIDLRYETARFNLAYAYNAICEEQKALEIYQSLKTTHHKDAYYYFNYANALMYALDFEEAKKMYQKAILLDDMPIFSINYAYLLLSLGCYEDGFRHYQKRLLLPNVLPLALRSNLSAEFVGKDVLVYYEQGFGDSIMFWRFIPLLLKKVKSLQIYLQKPLYEVFADKWGKHLRYSQKEISTYESAFSLLSVPSLLGIKEVGLDMKVKESKKVKKIGVFFSSNKDFIDSKEKSIPIEILLETLRGFEIYSLQPEGIDARICKKFGVCDLSGRIKNFKDTLNELKKLDVLVSVDSAIVHLAGMFGLPTIVLLHKRYDWRWGRLGQIYPIKSQWYDCITGIAQERAGEWGSALEILKRCLNNV